MIVSSIDLRREGSSVLATLVCHLCAGFGRVLDTSVPRRWFVDYTDLSNHPSLPCDQCGGTGKRRLESTHDDFAACWRETTYHLGLTKAERVERDEAAALLTALEAEATEAAIACGGRLEAQRSSSPASLEEALDRVAARLPELAAAVNS